MFVGDARRAYAATIAVGDHRTISCIGNMQVSAPGDQRNVCNRQRLNWKNVPDAAEVHKELNGTTHAWHPYVSLSNAPSPPRHDCPIARPNWVLAVRASSRDQFPARFHSPSPRGVPVVRKRTTAP